jgi:ribose/xylose/arabinose/galactoside ABC-type transport system permease subunit
VRQYRHFHVFQHRQAGEQAAELGVMASGFTFVGVDAYIQDIIKGLIIVVAVVIDQYRNKRKLKR